MLVEQWFAILALDAQLELKRCSEADTPEQVVSTF